MAKSLVLVVFLLASSHPLFAAAGKWTPEQLLQHDPAWLEKLGLEIEPGELWDPERGGLLEAIVQINGCSSGFVSPEGLMVTNHHCAFSILQEHSTSESDLIENGFLAGSRGDELHGSVSTATVPHRFTDVTDAVEASVPRGASDLERYLAIETKQKALVAECEEREFRRCRLATYDDGVQYVLIEALEFRDVRLVYAPPRSVGEYGGEIDNWMWPRHSGDFALLRVYSDPGNNPAVHAGDNRPYRPKHHLPVAREAVNDGSFVMVVGYPGSTYRRTIAPEVRERYELYFPRRARLYGDWLEIMKAAGAAEESARLALAGRIKSTANREKNSRGQVAAIRRGALLDKRVALDRQVREWAAKTRAHHGALAAYDALAALGVETRKTWDRDFLLDQLSRGSLPVAHALKLTRWAIERAKPDLEREPGYQDRDRDRALQRLIRDQNRLHLPTEKNLFVDWLERAVALEAGQRVEVLDAWLGAKQERAVIEKKVNRLLSTTRVHLESHRVAMFDESVEQLRAREDPLLALAFALWDEMLPIETARKSRKGAVSRHRPVWRRAVTAAAGRPVDPDANGTLRVSLAHVEGYSPADAVWMTPLTRVSGIVEKHTDEDPFDAPDPLLERAGEAPKSRWANATLEDVPVCFLASGDTTGGSSGSPVLNGRGELVGVNFDRVWENIANDFGYNPAIARNVSTDVRYMMWILEEIEGPASRGLLKELGVAPPVEGAGVPSGEN